MGSSEGSIHPGVDMIDVRLNVRSGYRDATNCPIIPPIDAPTM